MMNNKCTLNELASNKANRMITLNSIAKRSKNISMCGFKYVGVGWSIIDSACQSYRYKKYRLMMADYWFNSMSLDDRSNRSISSLSHACDEYDATEDE